MDLLRTSLQTGSITALILAGGRGSRMGGIDKGLQPFQGAPMARLALERLQAQQGDLIDSIAINANRNLATYADWGVPIWPDDLDGNLGPLAGFAAGLQRCATPWLLTVPCDTPLFPLDLASRMAHTAIARAADIALAGATEPDGHTRAQPVFCLMRVSLLNSLQAFLAHGGRKIDAWTALHPCALVPFDQSGDDPRAFHNLNTLAELQAMEQS